MHLRAIFTLLSVMYLIIEMQAWTFLSQIYIATPSPEMLSKYERFGYASSALGITLMVLKYVVSKCKVPAACVFIFASAPFIYITSIWSVYEIIHRAPDWIPIEARPAALQASIQTLSQPRWANMTAFYAEKNSVSSELPERIDQMLKHYPAPARAVQATYIQGFRALAAFDQHYQKSTEMLDKSLWKVLWVGATIRTQREDPSKFSAEEAEERLIATKSFIRKTQHMPHRWLQFLLSESWLRHKDPLLHAMIFPGVDKNIRPPATPLHYAHALIDAKAWVIVGQGIKDWPAYNIVSGDPYTQFRAALSEATLKPYAHLPGALLPIHQEGRDHRTGAVYLKASAQIAPFLFDRNGRPLMTLTPIYNEESRFRYINTLLIGLSPELRSNWERYEREAVLELASNANAWLSPTADSLHKNMLRAGVITPLLLAISSIMLLWNLYTVYRDSLLAAVVVIPVLACTALQVWPEGSLWVLKALLTVSVKESQIFLF